MDVYDQLVDLIVQCIDSILGIFHLHIVPFVKYCYVEVDKSYMWKWFVTLASKYGHFALENATPSDIGAVVITFLVVMIFFIYGKRILCFVYKRKGSKQEHKVEQYRQCEADIRKLVDETNCNPIFLRLAWSDAGTYDRTIRRWPDGGGCIGAVQFECIHDSPPNLGLAKAISILTPIQQTYGDDISWADLVQMAGAVAVEHAGGPPLTQHMRYGRVDATLKQVTHANIDPQLLLPCHQAPFHDGTHSADTHIRNVFYNRMGFHADEIVALMGAHTIGRAFKDRSGACPYSTGNQTTTEYTREACVARPDGKPGVGMAGGCSWTANWLTFDNSYFSTKRGVDGCTSTAPSGVSTPGATAPTPSVPTPTPTPTADVTPRPTSESHTDTTVHASSLLWLSTDKTLTTSPEFSTYFKRYRDSVTLFHEQYMKAHVKMSMLGAKLEPPQGFSITKDLD